MHQQMVWNGLSKEPIPSPEKHLDGPARYWEVIQGCEDYITYTITRLILINIVINGVIL